MSIPLLAAFTAVALATSAAAQEGDAPPAFRRQQLSEVFYCEGATFGDLDGDGHGDVISGPYWYAGPDFGERHEIYAPEPFDPLHYSDNFFAWTRDYDEDGRLDILFVGFPGKEAAWYRNPGEEEGHWERFLVTATVDNESPACTDLVGDDAPELVCIQGGRFGWLAPDPADPRAEWSFHPLSPDLGLQRFTHGLGVGDVDGDGRMDLLERTGWWRQPDSVDGDPTWTFHPVDFCAGRHGGAQMYAYDVDGDGDNDVITSLAAHAWGLSWFEQVEEDGAIAFVEHRIIDDREPDDPSPTFSEIHAIDLADVDGDGLLDIVTGKRRWSHGPKAEPEGDAQPVLYWFELVRDGEGARYEPHRIDADSGVGVQVVAGDVDGDGRVDVVVGNKLGTFVFLQTDAAPRDGREPEDAPGVAPAGPGGDDLNLSFESGTLAGWTATGEAFEGQPIEGDTVTPRGKPPGPRQVGTYWIGGYELHGDGRTGTLSSGAFVVPVERPWASFLVGGGHHDETRVELVRAEDGEVLAASSGGDHETMQRAVVDLRGHVGERVFVRLVDEHTGGWGHVNFDDLLLHAEKPDFLQDEGLPDLREYTTVEHAGLAPEDAARAMTVPDGFEVDLIAAEPDLHQPVALAIDARGRVWVAEARSYPAKRPEGEGLDDILVFEDRDGDGSFETRTVFAEGLNLVSGLEVGFGGVWVGAAPELLFLPDADDDLAPDGAPEVLLDGWGHQDTHETLNAFTWGPDGWLYGCHGVFTHSKVGAPGTPDAERVPLNAGVWRYHPQRHDFEVFAWGTSNPWGLDFDEHGQAFITACVIPHLFHMVQGGRYHRQGGRHFGQHVYEDIRTIADHRHYAGNIGDHAWWGRNEPVHLESTLAAGGGHAHCGALIYRGEQFPAEYRGTLLVGNVHGNRFNNEELVRAGSGFVGRHRPDFLLANDEWFRGINLKEGADGSVYFIDWYDERACHRTDAEGWDRTNGRLYRVRHGAAGAPTAHLDGLAPLLFGTEWQHRRARLRLQAGAADPQLLAGLELALRHELDTPERLRALWALHGAAPARLDDDLKLELLASRDEHLQAWTIQLELEDRELSEAVHAELVRLAHFSPSPVVRLYLASALQRMTPERRWGIAEGLSLHAEDEADHNLPLVLWYGVEPLVALDPARALALARASAISTLRRFVPRRAAHEASAHDALVAEMDAAWVEWVMARAVSEVAASAPIEEVPAKRAWLATLLRETARAFGEKRLEVMPEGWPQVYREIAAFDDEELKAAAFSIAVAFGDRSVFPELRRILADAGEAVPRRERALDDLLRGRDGELWPVVVALLDERAMRAPAIRAVASASDAALAEELLARYAAFDDAERGAARETLAARAPFALVLLAAVETGRVDRGEIEPLTARQLGSLEDEAVDALLAEVWGVLRPTAEEKRAEIARWKEKLTDEVLAAADLPTGRAVYDRTCAQCHVLFGVGGTVGPDITGSNRAELDYLLETVVDPNALIPKEYQVTTVRLADGRVVSGIAAEETEDTLTLVDQNARTVVWKDELTERVPQEVSMMPEGQLATLTAEEVRDLVAYLASAHQVPLRATPGHLPALFDGETLAGWSGDPALWSVEDGAIVGRTGGLERNAFLFSDLLLADFRLTLEVQLVDDQGNSGVQFRSAELEGGEARGYQADIGPGWWGKLYEEHARGLLAEPARPPAVERGAWNTYEILAVGERVRTALNGRVCVDLVDPEGAREGLLALQLHSGGPTEIRFRDLRLELDPEPRLATVPPSPVPQEESQR